MSASVVRLGLVGCGRLAEQAYVPAATRVDGLRIVAVADPDAGRRALLASLVGHANGPCAGYTGAAELVSSAEVDAVVVASPVGAHVADARIVAGAGLPALVEKPPAPDAAATRELAALDPAPWFGFNRRFDPGARRVRDRLPASADLDLRLEIAYRRRSWNAVAVHDDALLDLGPHLIDWARWLTGAAVVSVARASVARERATFELGLERGRARITAATDRSHRELLEVRAAGTRLGRHRLGGPVAAGLGRLRRGPHPLVTTMTAQFETLAHAVRGGGPGDLGTVGDAVETMTAIGVVRESAAADGATISLPGRSVPEGVRS